MVDVTPVVVAGAVGGLFVGSTLFTLWPHFQHKKNIEEQAHILKYVDQSTLTPEQKAILAEANDQQSFLQAYKWRLIFGLLFGTTFAAAQVEGLLRDFVGEPSFFGVFFAAMTSAGFGTALIDLVRGTRERISPAVTSVVTSVKSLKDTKPATS